jgi:ankyrin repeat protein
MQKVGIRALVLFLAMALACWAGAVAQASELGDAVSAGDLARVKALIADGANVDKGDMFGTPLHTAVAHGDLAIVTALLDTGANIEAKGTNGAHPLHVAALANRTEVAKLLLARGAQIESRDNNGMTPLLIAASNGNLDVTEALLDAGADVTAEGVRYPYDALGVAAFGCQIPIVKLLLSKGMNINARFDEMSETLLFLVAPTLHHSPATLDQRLAMIEFLLTNGLDPNVKNAEGKTAYDLSIDVKVRALLVKYGAKE